MKLITTLAITAATVLLISCNTMKGAGQDLQAGGEKLEHSAEKHKSK